MHTFAGILARPLSHQDSDDGSTAMVGGERYETPASSISPSGSERCRAPGHVADRDGSNLPLASYHDDRAVSGSSDHAALSEAGPSRRRRPFPIAMMLRIYCLQQ
jgi:hypothetical protein